MVTEAGYGLSSDQHVFFLLRCHHAVEADHIVMSTDLSLFHPVTPCIIIQFSLWDFVQKIVTGLRHVIHVIARAALLQLTLLFSSQRASVSIPCSSFILFNSISCLFNSISCFCLAVRKSLSFCFSTSSRRSFGSRMSFGIRFDFLDAVFRLDAVLWPVFEDFRYLLSFGWNVSVYCRAWLENSSFLTATAFNQSSDWFLSVARLLVLSVSAKSYSFFATGLAKTSWDVMISLSTRTRLSDAWTESWMLTCTF